MVTKVETRMVELLDPTARANPVMRDLAERTAELGQSTVALIDNSKPNAGPFLDRIGELLMERHPGVKLLEVSKRTSTGPAEFPKDLHELCNLAVTAFGD